MVFNHDYKENSLRMKQMQQEFLSVLRDYQGIIHKVNAIYFRSAMDRQDNFQEVTYQLWRSFPTLKSRERIGSWIYAIAINTSITKIRKDCRLTFCESVPDTTSLEPSEGDRNNQYQTLLAALHALNEVDRSVMLLYLEEYSYEEIAQIIGITPQNVGVKIHRLKVQLNKQLNK